MPVAGCGGVQSALDPAGGDALGIYRLTMVMTAGAALIFIIVTALLLLCHLRSAREAGLARSRRTIVLWRARLSGRHLSLLLPYGLLVMRNTDVPKAGALRIEVIGEQYWWRVRYRMRESSRVLDRERTRRSGRAAHHGIGHGGRCDPQLLDSELRRQDRHDSGRINRFNFTAGGPAPTAASAPNSAAISMPAWLSMWWRWSPPSTPGAALRRSPPGTGDSVSRSGA